MKNHDLLFVFIIVCGFSFNLTADEIVQKRNHLLTITLPASKTVPLKVGLAFTGRDLYRWTGITGARTDTLRLCRENDGIIPSQIEECDASGVPKLKGDGVFDDDDQLVFVISLLDDKQNIYLDYDERPLSVDDETSFAPKVKMNENPAGKCDLTLSASHMTIGVRGGGDDKGGLENLGRGCLSLFEWKGCRFADINKSWTSYFPKAAGTGKEGATWTKPKVIANGPVRTVVVTSCADFTMRENGKKAWSGELTRVIALWADAPIVDFEDIIRYKSATYDGKWNYDMTIPCGGQLNEKVQLVVPLDKKPFSLPVVSSRDFYQKNPYEILYRTDNPEEGWLALINRKEQIGLGFFYEQLKSKQDRERWFAYRPHLRPAFQYVRTNPGDKIEIRFGFIDHALRCKNEFKREFRYMGLSVESPETIRQLYNSWALSLDKFADVSWRRR